MNLPDFQPRDYTCDFIICYTLDFPALGIGRAVEHMNGLIEDLIAAAPLGVVAKVPDGGASVGEK